MRAATHATPALPLLTMTHALPSPLDPHPGDGLLPSVVAALRTSREVTHNVRHKGRIRELPSREALAQVVQGLTAALFPMGC